MKDRDLAFWFLGNFCGDTIYDLERIDFNDRTQKVCYDYINGGCKSRDDYEYLVEQYRIFQKLPKDSWIISELLG